RGPGLRIRVPDGADEPGAQAAGRDGVPRASGGTVVPVVVARARDHAARWRPVALRVRADPPWAPATFSDEGRVSFHERIRSRARAVGSRIVLPEAGDPRVVEAAMRLARDGLAEPILLAAPQALDSF